MKNQFIKRILLYIISVFLILCLIGVYFNKEGFVANDDDKNDGDDKDEGDERNKNDKIVINEEPGYRKRLFTDLKTNIGDFDIIHNEKSDYQKIEVIQFKKNSLGYDKCLLLNNEPQLCNNDEKEYHELIVHFPTYYISNLEKVLIIGGGDCMVLREIMKYPTIKRVDMLELDKSVISVSKKFFNIDAYENDPRVNIIIGDATKQILKLKNNEYDLIIIDTTEDGAVNLPIDEFDFYKTCKTKLKKQGIMIKNGDRTLNILSVSKLFKYIEVIDLADIAIIGDYKFILGSDTIDFKKTTIKNKELQKLNLKKYKYKNHKKHFFM
jgi:spermidine synthase